MESRTTIAGARGKDALQRAVWTENVLALTRRWHIARQLDSIDDRLINRYFPEQRALFNVLLNVSLQDLSQAASCDYPLFNPGYICSPSDVTFSPTMTDPENGLERDSYQEVYGALLARLRATCEQRDRAEIVYGLNRLTSGYLIGFSTYELRWLAMQPAAVARPMCNVEMLVAASLQYPQADWRLMAYSLVTRRVAVA